jgi:hypothetical protein
MVIDRAVQFIFQPLESIGGKKIEIEAEFLDLGALLFSCPDVAGNGESAEVDGIRHGSEGGGLKSGGREALPGVSGSVG